MLANIMLSQINNWSCRVQSLGLIACAAMIILWRLCPSRSNPVVRPAGEDETRQVDHRGYNIVRAFRSTPCWLSYDGLAAMSDGRLMMNDWLQIGSELSAVHRK